MMQLQLPLPWVVLYRCNASLSRIHLAPLDAALERRQHRLSPSRSFFWWSEKKISRETWHRGGRLLSVQPPAPPPLHDSTCRLRYSRVVGYRLIHECPLTRITELSLQLAWQCKNHYSMEINFSSACVLQGIRDWCKTTTTVAHNPPVTELSLIPCTI